MKRLKQKMWQSFMKQKFLGSCLIIMGIGFFMGIIYHLLLNGNIKENLTYTIKTMEYFKYNAILKDLIIMSILLVLSFFLVGFPLGLFFLVYESFSLGFIFSIYVSNYFIFGIIYFLIFFLIKAITLFILLVFMKKLFNILKNTVKLILTKGSATYKNNLINNFRKSLTLIIITLAINITFYFISPYIFSFFSFLIK